MARTALGLAEEDRLAAQLGFGGHLLVELPQHIRLGSGRKIQKGLKLRHEMYLAGAFQDRYSLALGQNRIAVEIGSTLLELGKVFAGTQRELQAKQTQHVRLSKPRCLQYGLPAGAGLVVESPA